MAVHTKDKRRRSAGKFLDCTALLEGARYLIVTAGTPHEIVDRIDAADDERLHYVETPGDWTG